MQMVNKNRLYVRSSEHSSRQPMMIFTGLQLRTTFVTQLVDVPSTSSPRRQKRVYPLTDFLQNIANWEA